MLPIIDKVIIMAFSGIKWRWIIGGISFIAFLILFAVRLNIFDGERLFGPSKRDAVFAGSNILPDRESWMNISQNGQKIGYAHRRFFRTDQGYHVQESVMMRINTMGVVQGMTFRTDGKLKPDMTLSSFEFDLKSSLFRFHAKGIVDDKRVTLYTEIPGSEKKTVIALKEVPHLANGILEASNVDQLKPGDSRVFYVFDPVVMAQRSVTLSVLEDEPVVVMGRKQNARKVAVDFMGAKQVAWVGKDGDVLKEKGILGITLEKVAKSEALGSLSSVSSSDLTEMASVSSNMVIDDPSALKSIKIRIGGIEKDNLYLQGDRQIFRNKTLYIQKESLPTRSLKETGVSGDIQFLNPGPFIQSNHPKIQAKMKEIIAPEDPINVKASKLVEWVYKHVEKRPVLSVPNALETLNNLVGDCNEHAVLLAALARAAGIPAQIEAGLVYHRGKFYYHAWNVLYLGTWITADAVMGQMPADVTHIRLVRGEPDRQIDLMGIIGKIKLKILEKM
jgi:hypothetical protein